MYYHSIRFPTARTNTIACKVPGRGAVECCVGRHVRHFMFLTTRFAFRLRQERMTRATACTHTHLRTEHNSTEGRPVASPVFYTHHPDV